MTHATTDYGIDAPGVIRNFLLAGAVASTAGILLSSPALSIALLAWGIGSLAVSAGMLFYAKRGKFRHRDRILNDVYWRGDETVLDVGMGRGLLAIGAAKRLDSGRVVGIDVWKKDDLSGNGPEAALANVEAEGVTGRVVIRHEDARAMGFSDETFDVVLSNLCLHNIRDAEGRVAACREIARVLKPGGVALISDFRFTADYELAFLEAGLQTIRSKPEYLDTFPPLRVVRAEKPAATES